MQGRITIQEGVAFGKPVIKGTRISVELILEFLATGANIDSILEQYPQLVKDDVLACIEYAKEAVSHQVIHNISKH